MKSDIVNIWKEDFLVKICVLLLYLSPHLEDNIYPISPISKSSCHFSLWEGAGVLLGHCVRVWGKWHQHNNRCRRGLSRLNISQYLHTEQLLIASQKLHWHSPSSLLVSGIICSILSECMSRPRRNPSRSARKVILVQPLTTQLSDKRAG